ncbi:MAG: signal recognition particle-docking protein FtsY [Pseudomonadales bacterium]
MKWFRKKQKTPAAEVEADAANNAEADVAAPEPASETPLAQGPGPEEIAKPESEPAPEPIAKLEPEPEKSPQPAAPQIVPPIAEQTKTKDGLFGRLKKGLRRTGSSFSDGMGQLFLGKKEIDDELLEELESLLIMADVGMDATGEIIANLTKRVKRKELNDAAALQDALQAELQVLLEPHAQPLTIDTQKRPFVILMVGVNGAGKTTTIGKLAQRFQAEGQSVMLAAGDTFRAAAVEQLQVWGERNSVPVIAQHTGADSASVIFDALRAAQARDIDVLIADTAGRLHNKDNLMDELKKVVRVMGKLDPQAPHEVMLVLDAGTGQNALSQAQHFQAAVGVSGITLTKLDGTAKGGIIFAIAKNLQLPIRFIGIGEQADDLRVFDAQEFVTALFSNQ